MLTQILKSTWPLFLGISFLMLANGLQGTLIGWRGAYEGFSGSVMGVVMAGYYMGYMAGSKFVQKIVENVGHVRVFAALASLASTAILMQVVFVSEYLWFAMRLLTGFCFAGCYVVIESWLNERADNVTRGSLFSIYMVVSFASMTAGQWVFSSGDPTGYNLFIVSSVLLSVSLVPLLISNTQVPEVMVTESMSIRKLYGISPAGISSLIFVGVVQGITFTMGTVYAKLAGLSNAEIATFMSILIAFGAIFQWPMGKISDLFDRRVVIVVASGLGAIVCFWLLQLGPNHDYFILLYGILGALSLPLYSLAIAHANDRLRTDQMVAASGTLVFTFGIGSIVGPLSMGFIFDYSGPSSYFIYLCGLHALISITTLMHVLKRDRVDEEEQVDYQVVPASSTGVAMEAIAQIEDGAEDDEWQDSP